MRALTSYIAWETLFFHGLTGLLFAAINALILANVTIEAPWALVIVGPVLLVSWAGWAMQARAAASVARAIRESGRDGRR